MPAWSAEQWALVLGGITTVIAAIAAAAVRIISALQGVENKVDKLEVKVDGRLSELLERTALSSRAEGVVAGRVEMGAAPPPLSALLADTVLVPDQPAAGQEHIVLGIPVPTPPILLVPVEGKDRPPEEER